MTAHTRTAAAHSPLLAAEGPASPYSTQESPKPWDNPNPLFDVEQFAHYLGQKPDFIRALIKEQRIASVKIGRKGHAGEGDRRRARSGGGRRPATQPLHIDRFGNSRLSAPIGGPSASGGPSVRLTTDASTWALPLCPRRSNRAGTHQSRRTPRVTSPNPDFPVLHGACMAEPAVPHDGGPACDVHGLTRPWARQHH